LPVGNELRRFQEEHPELEIEHVEVTIHPLRTWKDGIRVFPALKIGDDVLSGVIVTGERARRFLVDHLKTPRR
jgi:hypothetical protein